MNAALKHNLVAASAPATRLAYARAWAAFAAECGGDLPAEPATVAAYLSVLGLRCAPSTVRQHAAAISAVHIDAGLPSPAASSLVRRALSGHERLAGLAPHQATGIDHAAYDAIVGAAPSPRITRGGMMESEEAAQRRALVDVCLIGLMRDAMLRRSEAAAAQWADLTTWQDMTGRLEIPRSKTDQAGRGTLRFVSGPVMDVLRALRLIGGGKGKIFPLQDRQICRRIAKAAAHAGLVGCFSGHSPRVGMAQDLAISGASLAAIMQAGGWDTPTMPALYIRGIEAGQGAVARWYATMRHDV